MNPLYDRASKRLIPPVLGMTQKGLYILGGIYRMKYYILEGTVNGYPMKDRTFLSRHEAEEQLDRVLENKGLQVEVSRHPSKHTEEFVCDQYTRFSISRCVVEA